MPKLRNASTDIMAFAQWVGRKLRNHNPLQELKLAHRQNVPNIYKSKTKGDISIIAGTETSPQVLYVAGGRAFIMEIREVPVEQVADLPRLEVAY